LKKENERVLVDTSIWIEFFKSRSKIGDVLETLLKKDAVWVCGIILFELVQGIRSDNEKAQIIRLLKDLNHIEMTDTLWAKAGDLSRSLKAKGITLPYSDILMAAIALDKNLSVFTLDKHFEHIPGLNIL
jgi:tRNA(fMet)-specific endonuclease VapC